MQRFDRPAEHYLARGGLQALSLYPRRLFKHRLGLLRTDGAFDWIEGALE